MPSSGLCNFAIRLNDVPTRPVDVLLRDVLAYACQACRIPDPADKAADNPADLTNGESVVWPDVAVRSCPHGKLLTFARVE